MIPLPRTLLASSILYNSAYARTLNVTNTIQANSVESPGSHFSFQPLLYDTAQHNFLGQRSTLNIIWSCLATIFACTWASVHMNVPPTSDSDWKVLRRRFKVMVYMLLLPELIVYWASKQWYGARKTARKHSAHGWTMTHGFFVGMGGFVLHENGKSVRPLDIDDLEDASEIAEIDWPQTSEDDILDKSKGDYFTKAVVVLQATWFIFQCIARWAIGLAITELEVVTLGFAALSGVMCFFWLKKPLDVRRPVLVVGNSPSWKISNAVGKKNEDAEKFGKSSSPIQIEGRHIPPTDNLALDIHNNNSEYSIYSPTQSVQGHLTPLAIFPNPPPDILTLQDGSSCSQHNVSRHHRVVNVLDATGITSQNETIHIPTQTTDIRRNLIDTKRPILEILLSPFQTLISDMFELKGSGSLIADSDLKAGDSCHVSTFYAAVRLPIGHKLSLFLFGAGTIFGGIHCIAWVTQFPTVIEEWAWKASALSVTILPSLFAVHWITYSWYSYAPTSPSFEISISGAAAFVKYVFFVTSSLRLGLMFSVYVVARISLLVLPFISLRALPISAYVDISWTNIVPHV